MSRPLFWCFFITRMSCDILKFSSDLKTPKFNYFKVHTGQCKRTGGCYNELVVAFFSTGGGVKGKKFYTC